MLHVWQNGPRGAQLPRQASGRPSTYENDREWLWAASQANGVCHHRQRGFHASARQAETSGKSVGRLHQDCRRKGEVAQPLQAARSCVVAGAGDRSEGRYSSSSHGGGVGGCSELLCCSSRRYYSYFYCPSLVGSCDDLYYYYPDLYPLQNFPDICFNSWSISTIAND